MRRVRPLAAFALVFAIGAAWASDPTWPAPCADAGTCWLAWDKPDGTVTRYEVVSGDLLCGKVQGWTGAKGKPVPPPAVYQPHPGDGCWDGAGHDYAVLAVNDWGTSPGRSASIYIGPQDFACYDARCEVPCAPGLPLRFPKREGCP